MRKFLPGMLLLTIAMAQGAWAQDEMTPTTTAESSEVTKGVYDRFFRLSPRVGVLGYQDGAASYTSRIVEGVTADFDLAGLVTMPSSWNLGVESGILYSHTGSPGANFFGSDAPNNTVAGSNSFLVPMYLSTGYRPSDNLLVAVNLGASMLYRSVAGAMTIGRTGDGTLSSQTDFFPSVGLNTGWALGKSVALSLRGDYIPTPADDMFTATLGATFGVA